MFSNKEYKNKIYFKLFRHPHSVDRKPNKVDPSKKFYQKYSKIKKGNAKFYVKTTRQEAIKDQIVLKKFNFYQNQHLI